MNFLSNDWFAWFLSQYSVLLMLIPSAVAFLLKLAAIFHPAVPSGKIIELIQQYWPREKAL